MIESDSSETPVDVSLATKPTNLPSVPGLLEDITRDVEKLNPEDIVSRQQLVEKARALVLALQTPREMMVEQCWAQVFTSPSVP